MIRKLIFIIILSWVTVLFGCFSNTDKESEISESNVRAAQRYSSVSIIANATYYTEKPMKYVGNSVWEIQQTFGNSTNEKFIFYAHHRENNITFGDNEPDRTAEENGSYIKVSRDKICIIRFNEVSNRYSIKYLNKATYWGLGNKETKIVSNDRDYEWYLDQKGTGEREMVNCGPTCAVMALRWRDKNNTITVAEARVKAEAWRDQNGLSDMEQGKMLYAILGKNKVKEIHVRDNFELLKSRIDAGNILIADVDMRYISENINKNERVNKFSTLSGGHFIILKGYRVVDGQFYWEVYDPYSWGDIYKDDGTLKGKNRYYKKEEVQNALIGYLHEILK